MKRGVPLKRVVHQFRPPPSDLTLEQRRAKVALAKKNSHCHRCGQAGHWSGDRECPMQSRPKTCSEPASPPKAPIQNRMPSSKKKIRSHVIFCQGSSSEEDELHVEFDMSATRDAVPIRTDPKRCCSSIPRCCSSVPRCRFDVQ